MGLICYVLYLPVKKLAYYLNTGSLASDSLGARNCSSSFRFPSPLSTSLSPVSSKQRAFLIDQARRNRVSSNFTLAKLERAQAYELTAFL